jgi:hypothetical protein
MPCAAHTSAINARLARLLTAAVDRSGKIAPRNRSAAQGMNKDTFLQRSLRGTRADHA